MKVKRLSGAELAQIAPNLPQTTVGDGSARTKPDVLVAPLVQINIRCSEAMARMLGQMAQEEGSLRLVVARLLQLDGRAVPDVDLRAPGTRKWR
jgi:hypothetical protein